jgi:hypothetical protein
MKQDEHLTNRKAGMHTWVGFAVLALPALLISIDVSVMILALPHIGADLVVVGSAPPEKAGAAVAMLQTRGEFAFALGIAPWAVSVHSFNITALPHPFRPTCQ